jgi:hypothetical protein
MDLTAFRLLLTDEGQTVLQEAAALEPREEDFLSHFGVLNRRYPPGLVRPALETAILRLEASSKFPYAGQMYFTREALEQSTSSEVSAYRAGRYRPFIHAADLGCSIGGDTQALANGLPDSGFVVGIDMDPLRLAMAQENLRVLGLSERCAFALADLNSPVPLSSSPQTALFFDPARRLAGRRIFSVERYQPPLNVVRGWLERFPALGVKLSPGVDLDELQNYPAEVEFISLKGELKEAVLWFGALKTTRRRATLLPGPHSLQTDRQIQDDPKLPLSAPVSWLHEPDPSILRAGLVADLGLLIHANQLDPSIAYLTSHEPADTPFVRSFQVLDWFPFQLKRLRAYLRDRGVGRVTVKKRGSPIQPEELIQQLRLEGEAERVVVLTQMNGKPVVLICLPGN